MNRPEIPTSSTISPDLVLNTLGSMLPLTETIVGLAPKCSELLFLVSSSVIYSSSIV